MIDGSILIGATARKAEGGFQSVNPATGESFGPQVSEATTADVAEAAALAAAAYPVFANLAPNARADFLDAVAEEILAIGDVLIETAMAESGLPRPRLEGERGRTVGQLKLFAAELRKGEFLDVTIDPALPERAPLPRPDLRRMNVALGPVVVFGASNFPLAFSVAGGDTASAFAAGCPVLVKGHPAHPGTGELVARAIAAAVAKAGLPEGVFSYLPGRSNELGGALVTDPRVKAVGFTGSRFGGLALVKLAQARKEPIPVYAELSAINPVVLLPGALAEKAEALGKAFAGSLTMGAGQFCTNPGLILALESEHLDTFIAAASGVLTGAAPLTMLTPGIAGAYVKGVAALDANAKAERVVTGQEAGLNQASPALFKAKAADFIADESLGHEVFGSSSVVVVAKDVAELNAVIAALEGQLTATIHAVESDNDVAAQILPGLVDRVAACWPMAGPRAWKCATPWSMAGLSPPPQTRAPPRSARWR